MHLSDNTQLQGGKYRILRFIAQGGFGITYEGLHVLMGHRVAIKEFFVGNFCQRDNDGNVTSTQVSAPLVDKLRGKFIAEARTLHQLSHPGIVKVHDVFEENGTAYYVMDFIDGESLDSVIKRHNGKLPEDVVRKYLGDVADALSYLHQRNRLHLDIKPANIMIDHATGQAKLIDFGVSKQYDEENGQNTSTLVGKTPGYAPIEQLNSEVQKFSPATDIYALGATLYKALSGVVPPSPSEILEEGLPPLPSDVSPEMQRIIKKAMEVKRSDRYATIDSMMADLNNTTPPFTPDEVTVIDAAPNRPITQNWENKVKSPKISAYASKDKSTFWKWADSWVTKVLIIILSVYLPFFIIYIWHATYLAMTIYAVLSIALYLSWVKIQHKRQNPTYGGYISEAIPMGCIVLFIVFKIHLFYYLFSFSLRLIFR